ncbi:MAG: filamentous hemagglutinin N-terminal protein [Caulobacteraceae bacterium]|nr:filamentous hemagglutinin N-terminal protein [Caulobacteraceae bacterium]
MTQALPYRTAGQRNLLCCTAVGLVMTFAGVSVAHAQTAGAAGPTIAVNGSTTDVTLNQSRTLIDWPTFDVAADQTLNFHFQANRDIVLNRVTGVANVDGALNGLVGNQVGGNVWIYGSKGVVFGPNARVNVGGLLSTTSPLMSDSDFLSGSGNLSFGGGLADVGVTVKGGARLTSAGALALLAPSIATEAGATVSAAGTVTYGAAQNFRISFDASAGKGFDLISFEVPTSALEDGTVSATPLSIAGATSGSNVMMAAVSRPSVMNALISIDGMVTARNATQGQGGEIILSASGAPSKIALGAGSLLDASSIGAGQSGGRVSAAANIIDAYGAMDASGPAGGGVIRIGGGFQGKDASIANSEAVFIGKDATLTADASGNGAGGDVVVWSDRWTGFTGRISARGGPLGGDGGRAEVSSGGWLGYQGSADMRAPNGHVGGLLLDPAEIRIVSGVAGLPLLTNDYKPGAGVTTTDLGDTTIFTQLALGDLKISTDSTKSKGDGTIEFANGLNYVGNAQSNILTLTAENGFVFTDLTPITASGKGGFNVVLDAGKAAFKTGAAVFNTQGSKTDGSLTITGAGVNIDGALTSGAVKLTSTGGDITQSAIITATGGFQADAGSDNITLNAANKLAGVDVLNGSAISLNNDQATIVNDAGVNGAGALTLTTSTVDLTISGNLTRAGSITLASAGDLNADKVTASTGDLSMKGSGITFGGAVESTAGDVTLETTGGQLNLTKTVTTGATKTATLKSSADIAQTAGGTITAGTVTGKSVGGAVLDQANSVGNLGSFTNTGGGQLALTTGLDLTVTGAVTNTAGGPGAINLKGKSIAVGGALDGGSVGLTATAGDITQTATIATTAGFSAQATGGATTLTTAGNKIGGTISALKGSTVSFKNDQATSIAAGNITSGGALSLETTTGGLTVTGDLSQAGNITLTSAGTLTANKVTATTGDVAMTGSTIAFNGAVKSTAGAVSLETTGGALSLTQTVDANTNTTLKSSAGITQSAVITTGGLAAEALAGAVTLNSANKISGNVTQLKGAGVSLTNSQGLTVIASPNIASTGDLSLVTTSGGLSISGGAISAPGNLTLTAAGALGLDSIASSTGGNLSLKGSSLSFASPGSLSASSGDVSIETTGSALTLDRNVTAGATKVVTLNSSGAINQTAGIITGGTITGSSTGGTTLNQANAVSNLGAFTNKTSGALALTSINGLTVSGAVSNLPGAINLTGKSVAVNAALTSNAGSSSLTATNGSITQTAAITASGFSAQATGGSVTLGGANKITSVGTLRGQAVTFNNDQTTTISGLTIDAGGTGNVGLSTTTGNLTVPSISTAGSIVLDSAGALLGSPNLTSTGSSISAASHGASMDLGTLSATNSATGDITLNANGQDITFSSLAAGRDASLSGKGISTAGVVTVGRDYSLTGQTFSPFVIAPAGGVPRDFTVTDTLGGFTGSSMTAGRNLTINATDPGNNAPISLTDVSTPSGDLTVNGSSVTLAGAINAATHQISLTAGQGAVSQTAGTITAGKLGGSAVTGFTLASNTNAITSLGAITNTTSGGEKVYTSTGLDLTGNLTAAGQLVEVVGLGGALTQSGGIVDAAQFNVGGTSITATAANKADILRVNTSGGSADINIAKAVDLNFASITTGDLKVTAAGNLGVTGPVTLGTAAGTQNLNLIATNGGSVTDSAAGAIAAGSLSGLSAGGFVLDSALHDIGRLQNVTDTSATGIQFTDSTGSLNVSGLSAVNGPITISTPGALVLDGAVTGSSAAGSPTTLTSTGGKVSQTVAGVITAGQVKGSAVTGFDLSTASNLVSQLGDVTNTTSGGIAFEAASGLAVPGTITASGQTVALTSNSGAITQTGAGLITAATLNASGATGLTFGGANQLGVASLTNSGAGAVSLTNAAATGLTVSASTTGDITLKNNGNLTLGNIVAGPVAGPQTASFTSVNGTIGQSGGTGITAGTVTGSAAGVFDLTTSSTNQVSHIGDFKTAGAIGAGLVSTVALSIDGAASGGTGLAIFAAPSLTLSGTGSVTGGASGVELDATGAGGPLTLAGAITTAGPVVLTSKGAVNQTGGTITGGSLSATGVGGITLGNVNAASITSLSNTSSGDILLTDTAATVSSGAITNPVGKITVSAPNGPLAFSGAVQGSGDVSLSSLGALSGTSATSTNGALGLSGVGVNFTGAVAGGASATVDGKTGGVTLGSLNSGTGDATVSGGAIAITGAVNVGRDYKLTGTSFNAGALAPTFAAGTGRDFILSDTAGGLTFTNLSAPRDLTVTATDTTPGDNAQIVGAGLTATTGKITVNGTRVTLSGPVTATAGDVNLTSTVGGIGLSGAVSAAGTATLASAGTIVESGAGAVKAGHLAATATGGIAMAGANTVPVIDNLTNNGAGGVLFRNTAPATTLTAVTTGSGDIDVQSTGAITLPNPITAPAGLRIVAGGALNGQTTSAATTTLGGNGVALTSVTSTGATTITGGAGAVNVTTASSGAGDLGVTGGVIQITTANSGQAANINGTGNVTLGTVTATGAADLESGATLGVTTVQSGAGGLILKGATVNAADARTTGAASVTGTNAVNVTTQLKGGTGVTVSGGAGSVGLALVDSGTGALLVTGGPVQITSGTAGTTADVTGSTTVDVTTLTAGGAATVTATGALTAGTLTSTTGDLTLKGSSVGLTTGSAGRDAIVTSTGNATLGSVTATRRADLQAGATLAVTTVQSGTGGLNLKGATINAADARTTGAATVTGTTAVNVTTQLKGAGVTVNGGAGSVSLALVDSGAGALLVTGGPVQITTATAGTTADVTGSTTVDVTTLTAGGAATLTATNALTGGSLTSTGGDLTLKGSSVNLTTGSAGRDAIVNAGGNATLGAVTATRAADLQAGSTLAVTTVQSGSGGLNLKGATVNAADARTTGAATVTGTSAVNVTTQLKGGTGAAVNGGAGSVNLALVDSGTGALVVTGGPVQITSGTAGTTADITGSTTVNVTALTSGGAATLTATNALTGGTLTSTTGDLTLKGSGVTLTTGTGGRDVIVNSTGNATLGTVTATRAADLQSTATLAVTTVQSGAGGLNLKGATVNAADARTTGAATVTGANAVNVTTQLKGGTSATVNGGAGSVSLALVDSGTGALIVTGGPVQITSGTAGTTADVTGSTTVNIAALTSGGTATVTAINALTGGTLTSTSGDLVMKGSSVALTTGSTGRDASLTSTAGNVQFGDLTAVRNVGLTASGDISGNLVTLGGNLTAQAGGDVGLKKIVAGPASVLTLAGRDVVVGAATGATPGAGEAQSGGVLSIDATRDALVNVSGPANLSLLKAGRDAKLSTLNGDATVASVQAGNSAAINATGGSANVSALTLGASGVSASLVATNDIVLGAAAGVTPLAGQVLSAPLTATVTLDAGRDAVVNLASGARINSLKTGRDLNASVAAGDLSVPTVLAGRNAQLTAAAGTVAVGAATATTGDLALLGRAASLTTGVAGGNLSVRATTQAVQVTSATAGGDIAVTADAGAANLKSARLTGAVAGVHGVTVTAGANATLGRLPGEAAPTAAGTLVLDVPARATVTVKGVNATVDLTGPASLTRVEATGGDVTVKSTDVINVAANGAAPTGLLASGAINVTGGGAVAVNSAVAGGAVNLTATTGGVTSGRTTGTAITATAAGGAVSLAQTTASGALTATGQSVSIGGGTQAGAGITLTSTAGNVTASDAVNATGDLIVSATGGGAMVSGTAAATGKAQIVTTGPISIASLMGSTILLRGSDLNLTSALTATKVCAPTCAAPTLVVESAQGGLNLGDATAADPFPTAPMNVSKDEFARIRGDAVTFYAGDTTNAAKRGDVRIGDLALDITKTDTLKVLAGNTNSVQVTGAVLAGAGGGGNLVIGGEDATAGWTPKTVYVTGGGGAIGHGVVNGTLAQQAPLKSVTLNAVDDVLLGSAGFVTAINQARSGGSVNSINIIRNSPNGVRVQPADLNRVFLTADTATFRANGVIVQQNTSLTGNQSGIVLTNRGNAAAVATFGRTSPPAGTGLSPLLIDLSLGYFNAGGAFIGRQVVAASPSISLGVLSRSDSYRINGCAIGIGGSCTPLPNTLVDISIGKLVEGVQLTTQDAPPTYDPTITGAGNEEIWRNPDCLNQEDQLCR